MIQFRVLGIPKGQPRPKAFVRKHRDPITGAMGSRASVYDPGTAEGWKSEIARAAQKHIAHEPIDGPVELVVHFFMPRPMSHFTSGGQRNLKPKAPQWHTKRPDLDNLLKAVLDALTSLSMWADDSLIYAVTATKGYAGGDQRPGAEIILYERDARMTASEVVTRLQKGVPRAG